MPKKKTKRKNPRFVKLGQISAAKRDSAEHSAASAIGGLAGGPARAAKLSAAKRKQIASNAAKARWAKKKKDGKP